VTTPGLISTAAGDRRSAPRLRWRAPRHETHDYDTDLDTCVLLRGRSNLEHYLRGGMDELQMPRAPCPAAAGHRPLQALWRRVQQPGYAVTRPCAPCAPASPSPTVSLHTNGRQFAQPDYFAVGSRNSLTSTSGCGGAACEYGPGHRSP
jgi:hypothetical protein